MTNSHILESRGNASNKVFTSKTKNIFNFCGGDRSRSVPIDDERRYIRKYFPRCGSVTQLGNPPARLTLERLQSRATLANQVIFMERYGLDPNFDHPSVKWILFSCADYFPSLHFCTQGEPGVCRTCRGQDYHRNPDGDFLRIKEAPVRAAIQDNETE